MSVSTRGVVALLVVAAIVVAMVVARRGEEELATWLLTGAFGLASLWAGLSVVWAYEFGGEGALTAQSYLSLLAMSVSFTVYFAVRARADAGLTGGWS